MDISQLRALFTKPYGARAPTEQQWREAYSDDVVFEDPTQKKKGLKAYLDAQEGLLRRCDDVLLKPLAIACDGNTAFVEWEMGLKIKGIEFVYPGATRLLLNDDGKIVDHRDYFDFVGPTFEPVPVIGGFVRWLYKRFVS
ncbi:MAG: nuclear transport factor 2 family protein [Vulcanococcus sp.]|uniref:nuclear transport factor 2 family protein n=1 Tax=Vulcanococcus sp. TaxID=2856995 RepID=UPI0025FD75F5|nr:nuclear transport factor 2 family protein [Vulcanococcus sp.]MBW0173115.1 nuclear transport factor 2 family protein [Vulcanococcus sp.]MBW0180173.1 nuclear transport factor 2 family protein [Vulcanococcus sp.]